MDARWKSTGRLGPGLLEERVTESALCIELKVNRLAFTRQVGIPLYYRGELIAEHRPDLVVEGQVIVEVKSVERLAPIHWAQVLDLLTCDGFARWAASEFQQSYPSGWDAASCPECLGFSAPPRLRGPYD